MAPTATQERYKPRRAESESISSREDLSSGGFVYPVRLTEYFETTLNDDPDGTPQLYMEFERLDQQWDTGEAAIVRQRLFLLTKDGDPLWEGSDLDIITGTFSGATDSDFLDIKGTEQAFIGHCFLIEDEDTGRTFVTKAGKERKAYQQVCKEYLGADYEYTGKVKILPSQSGEAADAGMSDEEVAGYLVELFSGESIADLKSGKALDIVKDDSTLAEVKQVLGKPLRGGLVKPKSVLIDLLIAEGYAVDEDGIFADATTDTTE